MLLGGLLAALPFGRELFLRRRELASHGFRVGSGGLELPQRFISRRVAVGGEGLEARLLGRDALRGLAFDLGSRLRD